MSEINVISRTQKIIVEPYSRSVSVINMGPIGPGGPAGLPGEPGEPGGTLLSAFWQYATAVVGPPSGGQMRTNSPITTLWIHETDTDGFNREVGLGTIADASRILVRAANGTSMDLLLTGSPVDNGNYWTLPVSVSSGSVTKGSRTQLNFIAAAGDAALPLGGVDGDILTKLSAADGDAGWVPAVAAARRSTKDDSGATYTPIASDENRMVKLTNSGAITVTMPSNATTAIPVYAEFDYVWWGIGQPSFAEGSGATVVGTPGLKLRARYSACTAKKMATDTWLIYGDLSA